MEDLGLRFLHYNSYHLDSGTLEWLKRTAYLILAFSHEQNTSHKTQNVCCGNPRWIAHDHTTTNCTLSIAIATSTQAAQLVFSSWPALRSKLSIAMSASQAAVSDPLTCLEHAYHVSVLVILPTSYQCRFTQSAFARDFLFFDLREQRSAGVRGPYTSHVNILKEDHHFFAPFIRQLEW